jgi:hypothetical protein
MELSYYQKTYAGTYWTELNYNKNFYWKEYILNMIPLTFSVQYVRHAGVNRMQS